MTISLPQSVTFTQLPSAVINTVDHPVGSLSLYIIALGEKNEATCENK
jgi:hypothetical protein